MITDDMPTGTLWALDQHRAVMVPVFRHLVGRALPTRFASERDPVLGFFVSTPAVLGFLLGVPG